ncbi:MAG: citramalate synthase [Promethearchaeota archaeon]
MSAESGPGRVVLCDTTLRDGTQCVGVNFSLEDKVRIASRLAHDLEVPLIEAGWPGANPKDSDLYKELAKVDLGSSKIVAFGSTRRAGKKPAEDPFLVQLADVPTDHVTIVGKTWTLHVEKALQTTLEENLAMISDSVRYLVEEAGKHVLFDAEHFFDGYLADPDYSVKCLEAAAGAGAECLVLCDTNGGMLPHQLREVVGVVAKRFDVQVGVHAHDDSGMGDANAIAGYLAGATHLQGTLNGFGERCGNTDLITLMGNLQLKLGVRLVPDEKLRNLTEVSRFVYELANMKPLDTQPFVGQYAFAHKGGIHISAMLRDEHTYEHVDPELVGNTRNIKISELAGRSSILHKAKQFGLNFDKNNPKIGRILQIVKKKEKEGYAYEGAEGSLELIMRSIDMNIDDPEYYRKQYFKIEGFRVHSASSQDTEATIKVRVRGKAFHTAAEGNGPVNAIDNALRKALEHFYPSLQEIELADFKVRIIRQAGTGSAVRVLVETTDKKDTWGTVGAHENIIVASWEALLDAYIYKLLKDHVEWGEETAY